MNDQVIVILKREEAKALWFAAAKVLYKENVGEVLGSALKNAKEKLSMTINGSPRTLKNK